MSIYTYIKCIAAAHTHHIVSNTCETRGACCKSCELIVANRVKLGSHSLLFIINNNANGSISISPAALRVRTFLWMAFGVNLLHLNSMCGGAVCSIEYIQRQPRDAIHCNTLLNIYYRCQLHQAPPRNVMRVRDLHISKYFPRVLCNAFILVYSVSVATFANWNYKLRICAEHFVNERARLRLYALFWRRGRVSKCICKRWFRYTIIGHDSMGKREQTNRNGIDTFNVRYAIEMLQKSEILIKCVRKCIDCDECWLLFVRVNHVILAHTTSIVLQYK